MKSETLTRIAGIAIIPAAVLACAGLTAQTLHVLEGIGGAAEIVGGIVLVLAIPALTARMAAVAGKLGLAGALLATLVVICFQVIGGVMDGFILPFLTAHHLSREQMPHGLGLVFLVGAISQVIGLSLLAVATIRRRPVPALAGWCWAASAVAAVASFAPVGGAVFDTLSGVFAYAGFVIAGWSLVATERRETRQAPAPAFP